MATTKLSGFDWTLLVVLAVTAGFALVYVPLGFAGVARLVRSEAVAAWVQAFGTFVALWVAIWVPHKLARQDRVERREAAIQSAEFRCRRLWPALVSAQTSCETIREGIETSRQTRGEMDKAAFLLLLRNIQVPTESDIEAMALLSKPMAVSLNALASNLENMLVTARLVERVSDGERVRELVLEFDHGLRKAQDRATELLAWLDEQLP